MSTGCLSCITSSHQQNFTLNKMFQSILKALDQTHSNTSYTLWQFCQRNAQSRIVQTTHSGAKNEPKGNMLRYWFLCVLPSNLIIYGTCEVPHIHICPYTPHLFASNTTNRDYICSPNSLIHTVDFLSSDDTSRIYNWCLFVLHLDILGSMKVYRHTILLINPYTKPYILWKYIFYTI